MDIDLRWGGDPNIIIAVEAALVASIPIQVGVFTPLAKLLLVIALYRKSSFSYCSILN